MVPNPQHCIADTIISVPEASESEMAELMKKVGTSLGAVQRASTLDWSSKNLTAGDCKAIAFVVASAPTLTNIECAL